MERHLWVTIDTEMDADKHWGKKWPAEYTSILQGIPKFYRPIWDKYDVHPVYFVSPDVLYDDESVQILRDEIGKGAIIGAHLHGEYIEPESKWGGDMDTVSVPFPCNEYSSVIEEEKLTNLTKLIKEKLGVSPEWYRAARFGADIDTVRILQKLGYRYDSSVTPHIDWSDRGGPDHSKAMIDTYVISDDNYYAGEAIHDKDISSSRDSYKGKIIELPVTITGKRWGIIGKLLPNNWLFYKWLRPTHMTLLEMKSIIRKNPKLPNLVMMFHSMEVMINKTPYVRWKWMQRYYLWRLDKSLAYAKKKGYTL